MKSKRITSLNKFPCLTTLLLVALVFFATTPLFAAEFSHYYKNHDPIISKNCTNSVWQEVTEYQIGASNFTPGKRHLIVINFSINIGGDNDQNAMARVRHGSTDVFSDSVFRHETRRHKSSQCGHGYHYWTVWTAVSGEPIHIDITQPTTTSRTVRTEEYEAFLFNLDDGLTENTHWFYQHDSKSGSIPTSWADGSTLTFDGGNNDWLILGLIHFNLRSTSGRYLMQIRDQTRTTNYSQLQYRAVDALDDRPIMNMVGLTNVGSNHTVKVQAYQTTADAHQWSDSKIFALDLSAFKDHWIGYDTTAVPLSVLDTPTEVYTKPDYSASQTGNVLIWSQEVQDVGEGAKATYSRMTVNEVVVPAGHSDAKRELPHGNQDDNAHHRIYVGSLNAGNNDIDIDMTEDVDVSPAAVVDIHSLCIFSMEMAVNCPTPEDPTNLAPGDGLTGVSINTVLDWTDCTNADTYEVYLDENPDPSTKVAEIPATQSTYDPDLGYCTHYYWKIVAKRDCGSSAAGAIWEFTTEDGAPAQPSNPDPAHDETGVAVNADLTWSHVSGANSYDVYFGEVSNPPYVGTTTDTTYNPTLDFNTLYYWKIKANNPCGYSTTGDVWEFTTGAGTSHYVDGDAGDDDLNSPYDSTSTPAKKIQAAINVCESGTVYVKKATGAYKKINMKTNVHVVGTDANWNEPASIDDYPTADRTTRATVRFLGPLTNAKLAYFKITGGKMEEGQVYVSGVHGEINNDVVIEKCWFYHGSHVGINLRGAAAPTIKDCLFEDPRTSCISSFLYGIQPASTSMIIQGCELSGSATGYDDGWGLRAGIALVSENEGGFDVVIGGDGNLANHIHHMGRAGIRLDDLGSGCNITIDNNEINNNSDGQYNQYAPGIRVDDVSKVTITRNTIHHNMRAGIAISNNSDVTIGAEPSVTDSIATIQSQYGNDIHDNYSGIGFGRKKTDPSSGTFVIRGNQIYSNKAGTGGGIAITKEVAGTILIKQNEIYDNYRAGIGIQDDCTAEIVQNHIYNQYQRAGIHTGRNGQNWFGGDGGAVLTIRQNKIHDNSDVSRGGGIDVRHASGTIENNLVYNNGKGGIRFSDWIDEIINNTVVKNGSATTDVGGGIIYDDIAIGGVMDPADGMLPGLPVIRNNISVYNQKAGLRVGGNGYDCPENLVYDASGKYWDYNLAYSNNGTGETNCGGPGSFDRRCVNMNFGGCGALWNPSPPPWVILDGSNNIIEDPKFVDKDLDDYQLRADSPAKNAGDDGNDMGAYGGTYPIDDSEIP